MEASSVGFEGGRVRRGRFPVCPGSSHTFVYTSFSRDFATLSPGQLEVTLLISTVKGQTIILQTNMARCKSQPGRFSFLTTGVGCRWPQAAVSLLPLTPNPVRKSVCSPGFHEHMHFVCALVTITHAPFLPLYRSPIEQRNPATQAVLPRVLQLGHHDCPLIS